MAAPHVESLPGHRLEQSPLPQVHRHVPWKALAPVAVGIAIAIAPAPAGLSFNAWMYFALFVAVIVGLILEPIPASAIGLLGVVIAAVLRLPFKPEQLAKAGFDAPAESLKWALAGFANSTVWLIFAAYMFALGYEKTGLGKRIALLLVKGLGRRTLGLGYAIALADLVLAPFTPSNTARSGGTVFPVVSSIPPLYGSQPGPTARRIGSYLMWTAFAATCVTSSMFLTALAPNLLAIELVRKTVKVDIGWTQFAVGFLPVGLLLLAVTPLLVYVIYPPELKRSEEVTGWAARELRVMGRISARELEMAALVVGALACWIFGRKAIDATTVAVAVVAFMVVSGVVAWEDVVANKPAWNVLVWFATLVTMAEGLNRVGFVTWFANGAAKVLGGLPVTVVLVGFVALFFVVHYLFASLTAHTTAVLPVILAAGAAVPGMPVAKLALLLCYGLGMMGILTPYATGPGPVYYGSGYISRADFWKLGLVFGAIFLAALLGLGVPWVLAAT